ncbi:hypothetical protein RhiirA4_431462 [Rhizophagus irregularis]|uniref:Uncharacterized protein n=1 Tax=Rhizophagus irregularis TaxID=588596 RepID=A0A2I1HPU3_9GLOM|nr:hypothetical protein RhiirA4_431462 [Rhizophagus irregularis]
MAKFNSSGSRLITLLVLKTPTFCQFRKIKHMYIMAGKVALKMGFRQMILLDFWIFGFSILFLKWFFQFRLMQNSGVFLALWMLDLGNRWQQIPRTPDFGTL